MQTLSEVLTSLEDKSPLDLANMCREKGITGTCGKPKACVMANLLSSLTGRAISCGVSFTGHSADVGMEDKTKLPMPLGMKMFISGFDAGDYPDLRTTKVQL